MATTVYWRVFQILDQYFYQSIYLGEKSLPGQAYLLGCGCMNLSTTFCRCCCWRFETAASTIFSMRLRAVDLWRISWAAWVYELSGLHWWRCFFCDWRNGKKGIKFEKWLWGSKDGSVADWHGLKIAGEPCVWCGGGCLTKLWNGNTLAEERNDKQWTDKWIVSSCLQNMSNDCILEWSSFAAQQICSSFEGLVRIMMRMSCVLPMTSWQMARAWSVAQLGAWWCCITKGLTDGHRKIPRLSAVDRLWLSWMWLTARHHFGVDAGMMDTLPDLDPFYIIYIIYTHHISLFNLRSPEMSISGGNSELRQCGLPQPCVRWLHISEGQGATGAAWVWWLPGERINKWWPVAVQDKNTCLSSVDGSPYKQIAGLKAEELDTVQWKWSLVMMIRICWWSLDVLTIWSFATVATVAAADYDHDEEEDEDYYEDEDDDDDNDTNH